MKMYEIVKHYRENKTLRDSFNALAEKTFGLDFEGWYQNGFWKDNYDPYSVVIDGKVAANVSVNRTDMVIGGERKRLYQLGTVMTEESFRNRGLIRAIMEEVEKDIRDADGVYLIANDSVVEFYPKFGFRKGMEYVYTKAVEQSGENRMVNVPMAGPADWAKLQKAMEESVFRGGCDMAGNPGLIFFYVSQYMQECVFYQAELDAYVIAEQEGGSLLIHNVFCPKQIPLDRVIEAFGADVKQVTLGFAPENAGEFELRQHHVDDTTFFVKGSIFGAFEEKRLRIPSLAHA